MTIKLAVAGGNRGARFGQVLSGLEDQIELVAICDPADEVLSKWTDGRPDLKAYSQFEDMVEDPGIDAIFIATPMLLHAGQALTALNAGKHVLSEQKPAPLLPHHLQFLPLQYCPEVHRRVWVHPELQLAVNP